MTYLLIMGSHVGTDITKHEVLQAYRSLELCITCMYIMYQFNMYVNILLLCVC